MFTSRPSKSQTLTLATEAIGDASVLASLLQYISENHDSTQWRAAWVIEKVALKRPDLLINERNNLIHLAMHPDAPNGLRRLLLTTLHHLPDTEELNIAFLNFLLEQMVSLQSPPGVQSIAMKLAERISRSEPSLHDEFRCIVRNMELSYYSSAIRSVAKRYI